MMRLNPILEIFELKPERFWRFSDGDFFAFEISVDGPNLILIKLSGEIHRNGLKELLKRIDWIWPKLEALNFSDNIQLILDCQRLTFIGISTRRSIFHALNQLKLVSHIWCYADNKWTQSYWRVIALITTNITVCLVDNYDEALSKANDIFEQRHRKPTSPQLSFESHWREELETRYFDRYLFKCIKLNKWKINKEKPIFKATFYWVETHILYIELSGHLTFSHTDFLLSQKMSVLTFLNQNGLSEINVVLNLTELTQNSFRSSYLFSSYLDKAPIKVNQFIVGGSKFEYLKIGNLMRFFNSNFKAYQFSSNLGETMRAVRNLPSNKLSNAATDLSPERYYKFLQKKQSEIYNNDERFRRQLFSHISQLMMGKDMLVPPTKFSSTFLGNEIFHALELLAADFQQTYDKLERENTALQKVKAQALQQQINPHFIFNTLNSILAHVYSENNKKAEGLLTNFADLMRMVIENSQSSHISFSAELEFLEKYIEMEQIRANNEMTIQINVTPKLHGLSYKLLIPPMIIQPFLEVAIWHRLMPSREERVLMVNFELNVNYVKCTIEDNGIGLAAAEKMRIGKNDPSGTKNVDERIRLLNKLSDMPVRTEILDVLKAEHIVGSRLIIHLPWKELERL